MKINILFSNFRLEKGKAAALIKYETFLIFSGETGG